MKPSGKYAFIRANTGRWPVCAMCRVLHVSQQGYYRSLHRPDKGERERLLLEQIYECLREDEENGDNYGVRRIIAWLRLWTAIIKVESRNARQGAKIEVKEGSTWERDTLRRNAGRR